MPSYEDFADHVGTTFLVTDDSGGGSGGGGSSGSGGGSGDVFAAILDHATPPAAMPEDARFRAPFSLVFIAADDHVRPQRIYTVRHPTIGDLSLFLVPIAKDMRGVSYEAVFG